jgi:hypothetical protein
MLVLFSGAKKLNYLFFLLKKIGILDIFYVSIAPIPNVRAIFIHYYGDATTIDRA